ncbi:MAG: hypothetical protein A2017_11740 [Lentisphaerae bacterium GWF2_44_16]|nr:MAG: hypothetical protein A2017_11740 [Lentisphaerae bacterium GWF2_44_16]
MTRFLIYLFPAMMDMVLGTAFFVATLRLAESGASAFAVSSIITTWAVVYMLVSQILGRLVNAKNSIRFIIVSGLGTVLVALGFILNSDLNFQYFLMGMQAVSTSFFFVSFQIFMKDFESGKAYGLPLSTGLYTFSWSAGMASGPFISGYVWHAFGWQACYIINIALGLFVAGGILYLKRLSGRTDTQVSRPVKTENPYVNAPDMAWLGWVGCGVCCFTVSLLKGVFPTTATKLGLSQVEQGNILAIVSYAQAITGLFLCRSRFWMYKALPVSFFAFSAIVGLILFAFAQNVTMFLIGALLTGIYSGGFFFYFVFHSLAHPNRSSFYVSINETVVGFTGIAGPVIGGKLVDMVSNSSAYICCAILTLIALLIQVYVHIKKPFKRA